MLPGLFYGSSRVSVKK